MNTLILKDIIKGDELRIASILEKYNSCDGMVKQISQAIEILETHCVQYGLSMSINGELLTGERKEFEELQTKYYELEARHEYSKAVNKKNTREVANLRRDLKNLKEKVKHGRKNK